MPSFETALHLVCFGDGVGSIDRASTGNRRGSGYAFRLLSAGTRKDAFKSALGYYIGGLWPIVPGMGRSMDSPDDLDPACDLGPGGNHALGSLDACGDIDPFQCLWRAPLALVATVIPPLGIIGVASPLTAAAGYLFPEPPGPAWLRSR